MLYEIDGLSSFSMSVIHDKWRVPLSTVPADFLMEIEQPYFSLVERSSSVATAQMHLASAAVRLPVTLEATLRVCPIAAAPFGSPFNLWDSRKMRWERGNATNLFPSITALGHCDDGPLGRNPDETLRHALVITLLLRDDFGHGEEGDAEHISNPAMKKYVNDRQSILDSIHACRIVQAETELIAWAIKCLG
jgi:hypothetical protein